MKMTLPNQLTTLRILLTPLFVWLFISDNPTYKLYGIIVFAIASLSDLYDGYHARKYGEVTRWGAFMDPLADKILITSAFIIFVVHGLIPFWMVLIVFLRDAIVTILRLYAEIKNKPIITSKSAKIKTLFQNVLAYVLLLLLFFTERSYFHEGFADSVESLIRHAWVFYAMLLLTIYTLYTGIEYIIENWQTIRSAYFGILSSLKV